MFGFVFHCKVARDEKVSFFFFFTQNLLIFFCLNNISSFLNQKLTRFLGWRWPSTPQLQKFIMNSLLKEKSESILRVAYWSGRRSNLINWSQTILMTTKFHFSCSNKISFPSRTSLTEVLEINAGDQSVATKYILSFSSKP